MEKRFVIIKILIYVVLAYILVFNIGTLLESHMVHKEYMTCLYDLDYKSSIHHTLIWCKTNIFLVNLIALLFVIYQTKRSRTRIVSLFVSVVFLSLLNSKTVVEIYNLIEIVGEWRLVNLFASIIVAILLSIFTIKNNGYKKERCIFYWISWIGVVFASVLSVLLIYIF